MTISKQELEKMMNYFYKILRLFFCPHKYFKLLNEGQYFSFIPNVPESKTIKGSFYDKECLYCGKVKRFGKKTY